MHEFIQIVRHKTSSENRDRAIEYIKKLETNEKLEFKIVINENKNSKTLEQLGYFFSTVIPICKEWQGLTNLEADAFLKENCMSPIYKEIMGKIYEIRKSTAKMKVNEMAKYIDDTISFLGINGVYVPPPTYKG